LVPAAWLAESMPAQVTDGYPTTTYGYQWWGLSADSIIPDRTTQNDMVFAWGRGDQHIFIAPHLDLTVVITASDYPQEYSALAGIYEYVLPALTGLGPSPP
jgi:CubicO group peptidase (beta-lactamase class C family)